MRKTDRLASAESGDVASQEDLMEELFFEQNDVEEAIKWAKVAASNGSASAMALLGHVYDEGIGAPQDFGEAFKWFSASAGKGDPRALSWLGWVYDSGLGGIPSKPEVAFGYYLKAARLGDDGAQYNVAQCYDEGFGVERNSGEAVQWLKKAAEQGHAKAQCNLGVAYEAGKDAGVARRNLRSAAKWYAAAARNGDSLAQKNLRRLRQRLDAQKRY